MLSVRCNAFWTLTSPCGSELEDSVSDMSLLFVAEFELWVAPMALAFLFMPGGTDPGWRTRWQALLSKGLRETDAVMTVAQVASMWQHKTRKSRHSHLSSKVAKVAHNVNDSFKPVNNTSTLLLLSVTGRVCSHYSRKGSFIIPKPSSRLMLRSFRTPGWDAATVGI